jgi:hypothetical protein
MAIVINGTGSISGLSNVGGISSAQVGSVLQVVTGTLSSSTSTASTSFVSTGLSASITPSSATNKILIIASFSGGIDGGAVNGAFTLYRGASTNLGNATYGFGRARTSDYLYTIMPITYLDSPATTSSTTYQIYYKTTNASNSAYLADVNGVCSITLMEIAA